MSFFPSVLWQKVLHSTSNSVLHAHLDKKFDSNHDSKMNLDVEEILSVTPHIHPNIFPPFPTENLSYQQLEYRLRNNKQSYDTKLLLDELHRKIVKKYDGNFETYVEKELLDEFQKRSRGRMEQNSTIFNQVLENEIQNLLQSASKREEERIQWMRESFIPHFGAQFDNQWKQHQDFIRNVERTNIDAILGENQDLKASSTSKTSIRSDGKLNPTSAKDSSMRTEFLHDKSNHIPFSQDYRLERAYMFEKKIMNIFKDEILLKNGENILEDPFGKGLDPSMEAYHPHQFISM